MRVRSPPPACLICLGLACARDLEGIVGKWAGGTYRSGPCTSWIKVKNPTYTQIQDRHEFFERRGSVNGDALRQLLIAAESLVTHSSRWIRSIRRIGSSQTVCSRPAVVRPIAEGTQDVVASGC